MRIEYSLFLSDNKRYSGKVLLVVSKSDGTKVDCGVCDNNEESISRLLTHYLVKYKVIELPENDTLLFDAEFIVAELNKQLVCYK